MLSDRVPLSIPGSKHLLLRRVSSQRTAAKFNFSLHLHNVSYFLYITYIIYINFIYITFTIYILNRIYSCSTSTISYKTPTMSFAQAVVTHEYWHRSSYTGVVTQELLHRSSYTGVVAQAGYTGDVPQESLHMSCCTVVNFVFELLQNSYFSGYSKFLSFSGRGKPGSGSRNVTLRRSRVSDTQTCGDMQILFVLGQPWRSCASDARTCGDMRILLVLVHQFLPCDLYFQTSEISKSQIYISLWRSAFISCEMVASEVSKSQF